MNLWDELIGQEEAVKILKAAARSDKPNTTQQSNQSGLAHAWLLAGPPGSGRINLALAFAAELLENGNPEQTETLVRAGTHPDLTVLSTDKVSITIDEVRKLITTAQYAPALGRKRVLIIEDADRMADRSANVLLKALEEPPEGTIWILCAPSDTDLIPTVRSRVRTVRLSVPSTSEVAKLLVQRYQIPTELAEMSARWAQNHVGMASRLASDEGARQRRKTSIELLLSVSSVPQSISVAAELVQLAEEDAKQLSNQNFEAERLELMRSLGLTPEMSIPPALRPQFRALEEAQKRRTTRSKRDAYDRILVDFLGVFRDLLNLQLHNQVPLINTEYLSSLTSLAEKLTSDRVLQLVEQTQKTRQRLGFNVAVLLAFEALLLGILGIEVKTRELSA